MIDCKAMNRAVCAAVAGAVVISAVAMMGGCAQLNTPQGQASTQEAVKYGLIAAGVANALLTAKGQVSQAEMAVMTRKQDFTAEQWAQLTFTDQQINQAISLVDGMSQSSGAGGQGAAILINAAELTQVYASTKAAYLSAKAIVNADMGKFTPAQQSQLLALDNSMQALDQGAQALETAAPGTDITPLLISALQVAALAAKVALAAGA